MRAEKLFSINKNETLILFFYLMSAATLSLNVSAKTELLAGKNTSFREPQETIKIRLENDISLSTDEHLALEVDDLDVSEMMVTSTDSLNYTPLQALIPGSHRVRLVKHTVTNEMVEIASWEFQVRQSATFKQYGAAANIQLTDNYRADEKNLFEPLPKRQLVQGSTQFSYSADTGDWHTQGQFDLIYNSSNDGQFGARKLDNGEFLFSIGNQLTDLQIGHQAIGKSDLAMDNFRRRGVSLGANFTGIHSRITGFSLSSEDVVGFRRGLAISDPQKRVDGVNFEFSPFADETLNLHGTWLTGKEQDTSGFIGSVDDLEPSVSKGTAKSISLTSQLLDNRLQMSADYANTNFDSNLTDSISSTSDNAYQFKAAYSDTTESGTSWNTGIEGNRVGTFFRSMGNQGVSADNQILQAFLGVQWSTVGVQANVQTQHDNVKHLVELPRIKTDLSSVSLNWTPTIENLDSWYGSPSFDTTYSKQDQKQTIIPDGSTLAETDSTLDNWQANANFNYTTASLGLSLGINNFKDFTGIQNNTDTTSVALNGSISMMEQKISLAPSIQFDRTKDLVTLLTSESITYGLQSTFIILQDELDGNVSLNFNQNQISDNSINNNASSAALMLNWHALAAKPNRPGVDVGLNAQFNNTKDKVFIQPSPGSYQVFLTISVVFPIQIGVQQ